MNFFDRVATRIARTIRENYPEAASEKVLFYSLSLLLNTMFAIVVTLSLCMMTKHLAEAAVTILIFLLIRYLSGGFHFSSSMICSLWTIFILTMSAHVRFDYFYTGACFDVISIIIFGLKAPKGLNNISRIAPKYYPILKCVCVLFISLNFFIQSSMLSTIFLIQALTLTETVYFILSAAERRWRYET
ncbi:accessory gene regulator B family protein [Paenibacillus ehimensis]|uniref:accessory gene regulator B family protein n=1 Tax=Paenibacillus ehimensis TaxID=79264 RepID=UPI003D29579E